MTRTDTPGSDRTRSEPGPASGDDLSLSERFGQQRGWWTRFGDSSTGVLVKLLLLAAVNGFALWMVLRMAMLDGPLWAIVVTVVATLALDWVYLGKGKLPLKYLVPGTAFLLLFQILPFLYTFYIAFTNYSTAQNLTKDQAIEQVVARSMTTPEDAIRYGATPFADDGAIGLLLADQDGTEFFGTEEGVVSLEEFEVVRDDETVQAVDDMRRLSLGALQDRLDEFEALRIPIADDAEIRLVTATQATVREPARQYDPDQDAIVDEATGDLYVDGGRGRFVDPETGEAMPGGVGWRVWIGTDNWVRAFTTAAIRDPFFGVLLWTYGFALASTVTTFALGLGLAITLNDKRVVGVRWMRALLIIPYAIPTFLTALIWRGMMNRSFGVLNDIIGYPVPWLVDPAMAKFSVVLVNLWFGFPYMFLICTGALQSIPGEVYEAADVDGASGWGKLRRITLPLLLVSTAPVLLSTFAFNFNNFNVIYLVTGGNPPISGAATPVGHTDILISYTYRIAFGAGGGDYGLGAVVAFITFIMVAVISLFAFRYIRPLEEVHR